MISFITGNLSFGLLNIKLLGYIAKAEHIVNLINDPLLCKDTSNISVAIDVG